MLLTYVNKTAKRLAIKLVRMSPVILLIGFVFSHAAI